MNYPFPFPFSGHVVSYALTDLKTGQQKKSNGSCKHCSFAFTSNAKPHFCKYCACLDCKLKPQDCKCVDGYAHPLMTSI